jgi:hypothetical protein
MKLDADQIHMLRLVAREADGDGWSKVSTLVWSVVETLPDDLVEKRPSETGGHLRLTPGGEAIVFYA